MHRTHTGSRQGGAFSGLADAHLDSASSLDWEALRLAEWRQGQRAAKAALWTSHTQDEYRALCLFQSMTADLLALAQPIDVVASAHRLVRDELRHVDVCLRVVEALGGEPVELRPPAPAISHPDPAHRIAEAMLVGVYLAETASLHIISTARRREENPILRDAMQLILRDESAHSRVGAEWLAACWSSWPEAARDHAASKVDAALARLSDGLPDWLVDAVQKAIETVMLPQLHAIGLSAAHTVASGTR